MALRQGQVAKVLEGGERILAMSRMVEQNSSKSGFQFSYEESEGLTKTAFDPRSINETEEVAVISGCEYGSPFPAKMIVFKNELLDREIGPLVIL